MNKLDSTTMELIRENAQALSFHFHDNIKNFYENCGALKMVEKMRAVDGVILSLILIHIELWSFHKACNKDKKILSKKELLQSFISELISDFEMMEKLKKGKENE